MGNDTFGDRSKWVWLRKEWKSRNPLRGQTLSPVFSLERFIHGTIVLIIQMAECK